MKEAADKAGRYAYRGRRQRKRDFRRLWIIRIGAATRSHDLTYSQFIHGLKTLSIELDRKMLAELAVNDQAGFAELVERVKQATPAPPSRRRAPLVAVHSPSHAALSLGERVSRCGVFSSRGVTGEGSFQETASGRVAPNHGPTN